MAGTINIGGLASGIDWQSTVDQLMAVEQKQVTALERRQQKEIDRQNALQTLNDMLLSLRTTSQDLADADKFIPYTANITGGSVDPAQYLAAEVFSSASTVSGTHSIEVQNIAYAQRNASSSAILNSSGTAPGNDTDALGLSGSFQINGVTIQIASSDSIQDIASKINSANADATASIMKVSAGDYRLVIQANQTGSTGLSITGTDLSGPLAGLQLANGGNILQAGQDATVVIDGMTITRASNLIDDALTGIRLNLLQAAPGNVLTLSVGPDPSQVRGKVQKFIDDYNAVTSFINEQFVFDEKTGESGILASDPILTNIQNILANKVLQAIPGLPTDRNSLPLIGVELTKEGTLALNETRFSNWLNTNPGAIRDVFSATGQGSSSELKFMTYGFSNASGSYEINITQPASKASVIGTSDLSLGLPANDSVTIIDASGRSATVNLVAGQSLDAIISAFNTEFQTTYTEQWKTGALLLPDGTPANASTKFSDLGLGVKAGDTITYSGSSRQGAPITGSFSILDPNTDTLGALMDAIQFTFNQKVTVSIDGQGQLTVTDNSSGDSQLSFSITANNEGGGSLNFGTSSMAVEGRYPMTVLATKQGNAISIESIGMGSKNQFSISQTSNQLGIPDGTYQGADVVGTINGNAATGSGQLLMGISGNTEGLGILYTGSATGVVGSLRINMGIAAVFDGTLDLLANPFNGLIQSSITSSQGVYDSLQEKIDRLNLSLEKEREQLTQSFVRMEKLISQFNATGQWLTQQISQFAKNSQ